MREIIFRGKTVSGKWVYGFLYCFYNFSRTVCQILLDRTNCVPDAVEVIPETVGQFTGLTDKNGKKIFEGDILHYTGLKSSKNIDDTCYVVFDNGEFALKFITMNGEEKNTVAMMPLQRGLFDLCEGHDSFAVIGNIHDNPELLEVSHV